MFKSSLLGERWLDGAFRARFGFFKSLNHWLIRKLFNSVARHHVGWDSSVGIATRYGLDGPGIESRCGRDFPLPSRLALGPTQPPIQ